MFQSIDVLLSSTAKPTPIHNHLDDLESFFYVLCVILFGFEGPGYQRSLPEEIKRWAGSDTLYAATMKRDLINRALEISFPEWWGDECFAPLLDFKRFFKNIAEE